MRALQVPLLATAAFTASEAFAAEGLKFGPAPAWVVPGSAPTAARTSGAPVAMLLNDEQVSLEPGRITTYSESVMRIQNPQGLAAGNISLSWNPATDTVTVNKLQIRRGDKIIDVLASGQTFTTLRRETNLDAAMLDGTLTANIQPEGLQVGDVIDLATTNEHSDPVLKGHVEALYAPWNGVPFASARARLTWPATTNMNWRESADLPPARTNRSGNTTVVEISAKDIQPLIGPKGAPLRFTIGRFGEATDFRSWSQVADLFAPLYRDAAVIAPTGSLRDELNRIRTATTDPKARTALALQLVQDRTRYVALNMGQGSYVPAPAETTWSRRFGDCKGKTALLLALLHELGIEAEPVLVNVSAGDVIGERLPMVQLFDHVLVRAHVGGKTYWLDGTRSGDRSLDNIDVPDFSWGLPLIANATLVSIVPPPLDKPETETVAVIDASKGVRAPVSMTVDQTFRGDSALTMNNGVTALSGGQRDEFFNRYWKSLYDFISPGPTTVTFDEATKVYRLSMKGEGKLDWNDRYFHIPNSSLGYTPNFDRPAGPLHDAPLAVKFPEYERNVTTIRFPPGFFGARKIGVTPTSRETLAGVEYRITSTTVSDTSADTLTVESSERALVPEIPYKEALAAASRLKELDDEDVAIPLPDSYRATVADIASMRNESPSSARDYFERGVILLNSYNFDAAISDFGESLKLKPDDEWSLANRGMAYVWKKDYPAAEKDFAAAEKLNPSNPVLARGRGLMAEQRGEYRQALDGYNQSLQSGPRNEFALGHKALALHALGRDEEALAESESALKLVPTMIDLRVLRANILFVRGDKQSVAREADLAIKENPTSQYAFVAAARIYARIGRQADATNAFDQALAIKPQAYIYVNRAQSRPFSDKAGRLNDLDAALKMEPENSDALAEKAEQLSANGDLTGALAIYDRVAKVQPDSDIYAGRRAVLLYKTGRRAEAEALFAGQHAKAKTSTDFNSMCWNRATAGILLEAALVDCRHALEIQPDNAAAMDSLALVLLRLGKIDDAITEYTLAIAKAPGSASYMGRSLAYGKKGDQARASADRAEALRLDGDAETRFAEYGLKR